MLKFTLCYVQAQAAGSKVADKAKNVASDLSELPNLTKQPNFFKGEGEVNATNEVKNKVQTCFLDNLVDAFADRCPETMHNGDVHHMLLDEPGLDEVVEHATIKI